MKNWKVIIQHKGKIPELTIKAQSYSEAYMETETAYPGCKIRSIAAA